MRQHANLAVDLTSATAVLTKTATSAEDCAMLCVSVSACAYLTYDAASDACVMYDATVSSLLTTNSGLPNAFKLYVVAAN